MIKISKFEVWGEQQEEPGSDRSVIFGSETWTFWNTTPDRAFGTDLQILQNSLRAVWLRSGNWSVLARPGAWWYVAVLTEVYVWHHTLCVLIQTVDCSHANILVCVVQAHSKILHSFTVPLLWYPNKMFKEVLFLPVCRNQVDHDTVQHRGRCDKALLAVVQQWHHIFSSLVWHLINGLFTVFTVFCIWRVHGWGYLARTITKETGYVHSIHSIWSASMPPARQYYPSVILISQQEKSQHQSFQKMPKNIICLRSSGKDNR